MSRPPRALVRVHVPDEQVPTAPQSSADPTPFWERPVYRPCSSCGGKGEPQPRDCGWPRCGACGGSGREYV